MHVDFKITAWERVQIPEEMEEEVLKGLKDGTIQNSNDLFELVEAKGGSYDGIIAETEEQILPSENDGQPTIEFFKQPKGQIKPDWKNGEY